MIILFIAKALVSFLFTFAGLIILLTFFTLNCLFIAPLLLRLIFSKIAIYENIYKNEKYVKYIKNATVTI